MADGIVGEFLALKKETDASLLAMQCGDFYEFFADDAETVGEELDLKISQKSSHGSSYPMAGVPLDDLTPYLKALVERGYRVAVADQYETGSGHAREITRVVTPGTLLETTDADARYLAAIAGSADTDAWTGQSISTGGGTTSPDGPFGLAFADITTGRFAVTTVDTLADARAELYRFDPAEILPGPTVRGETALDRLRDGVDGSLSLHKAEAFAPGRARATLTDSFGDGAVESVGVESESAVRAAGAVLDYIAETGVGVSEAMTRLQTYSSTDHVELDATTQRNLELTETMRGGDDGALIGTIDHTVTSPGGRLLREWLTRPRRSRDELQRRHDAVTVLTSSPLARDRLRETLSEAADLERLASRAVSGSAGARQLLSVRDTLGLVPALSTAIAETTLADSPIEAVLDSIDQETAADIRGDLDAALAEAPPESVTEGGLLCRGYDDDLDELLDRYEEARRWIDTLEDRVKRQYSVSHVTVDRNKTDGYYIQIGKSEADGAPNHFKQIKTLKNSKRFVTDNLEERERRILRLEEARSELERELFAELRAEVASHSELLQNVGRAIAELDVFGSLAEHAAGNDWVRPELTDPGPLEIQAGRHPVVEATTEFVPNDLRMDRDRGFLIVTGPNMSGKSTYLRQAALITLLAQIGSFVPAESARIGLVDGIYTRVGALDELAGGRSTFMVEMQELSKILHAAGEESLVILDEVGRGTATYDGISIAWAATEYLHNQIQAKTLFATHYHELTSLADHLPRVENVHVAADERDGDVTFLRTIQDGPTDRSYGIHVAGLAGVPDPVVSRGRRVLQRLRDEKAIEARGGDTGTDGESEQVVFDLSSGSLRRDRSGAADGGNATQAGGSTDAEGIASTESEQPGDHDSAAANTAADAAVGRPDSEMSEEAVDVLDKLRDVDVNETPPIELLSMVREWQQQIE